MKEHNCRVCGLYADNLPWGEDGHCPTHEICLCCGVEFGYEDYTLESTKKYRKEWLLGGAIWYDESEKPAIWNLENQLKDIPESYK